MYASTPTYDPNTDRDALVSQAAFLRRTPNYVNGSQWSKDILAQIARGLSDLEAVQAVWAADYAFSLTQKVASKRSWDSAPRVNHLRPIDLIVLCYRYYSLGVDRILSEPAMDCAQSALISRGLMVKTQDDGFVLTDTGNALVEKLKTHPF